MRRRLFPRTFRRQGKKISKNKKFFFQKKKIFSKKHTFLQKKMFFFPKKFFFFKMTVFFQIKTFLKKNFFQQKSFTLIKMLRFSKLFISCLSRRIVRIESAGKGMAIEKSRAVIGWKRIAEIREKNIHIS